MRQEESLPGSSAAVDAAADLGPVVLEQKPKPLPADLFLAVAILCLIPAAILPFAAPFRDGVVAGPICAGVGALFGVMGIVYLLANAGKASYLHEGGLRIREGKRWRVLRYQDVAEMTFKAVRNFHNGVYIGTFQQVILKPDEPGARPVTFQHTYKEKSGLVTSYREGTPLNRLCDLLTGMIARRMAGRLQRGEVVPWTPTMQISNRGVAISAKGRGWEEIDWERIGRVDVTQGVFRLWVGDEKKPRVQVPVATANFFPGYALVAQRLRGQPEGAAAGVQTPAPPVPAPTLAGGADSVRLEYTPTVEDHAALSRHFYRATPAGRKAWARRVWPLPLLVIGVAVLIGVINIFNKDLRELNGIVALALAVGMLLRPFLGWAATATDRAKLSRELKAAHQLAQQGRVPDPFGKREAVLGPQGYVLRTPTGEGRHGWGEASRIEWFNGYLFVFLAGDKVRRESIELIIPPRAFSNPHEGRDLFEKIQEWRETASAAGRRMF